MYTFPRISTSILGVRACVCVCVRACTCVGAHVYVCVHAHVYVSVHVQPQDYAG